VRLNTAKTEGKELQARIEQMKMEFRNQHVMREAAEAEVEKLISQLKMVEGDMSKYQSRLEDAEDRSAKYQSKAISAEEDLHQLRGSTSRMEGLKAEISGLTTQIRNMQSDSLQLRSCLDSAEAEVEAQKSWAEAARQEAVAQKLRAEAAEAKALAHRSCVEGAEEMTEKALKAKAEGEQYLADSELRNRELQADLQQQAEIARSALEDAFARIAALEAQLTDKHKAMRTAVGKAKTEGKQRLQAGEAKHREVLLMLSHERESAVVELATARSQYSELEIRIGHQITVMTDAATRAASQSEQNLQASEARARELQTQLSQQKESAASELEKLMVRIFELELQLSSQQSHLQAELDQLRGALATAKEGEANKASELRDHLAGQARTIENAVARELGPAALRLQASEQQILDLRAELAKCIAAAVESKESAAAQAMKAAKEVVRLEQQVSAQQKAIRHGQHELDALESTSTLAREQAEQDRRALRAAQDREAIAATHLAELESDLHQHRNAIRNAVSLTKANTKQRLRSADSRRKEAETQKREAETQKCEAETQLEQQENELRQLLELARAQAEQDLLACEAVNMDLQGKLVEQRECSLACERRGAELEDLLARQRELTAVESSAMESISELNADMTRQWNETQEAYEERIKKLKIRIRDLELMLEISKDFLRGDHNKTLDTDAEPSILSMIQPPPSLPDEMFVCKSGRQKMLRGTPRLNAALKAGMKMSRSTGSLHSAGTSQTYHGLSQHHHAYVVKPAGFSWPGRHLGPDEEGPVQLKFEESVGEE